jgi:hypothetical protein
MSDDRYLQLYDEIRNAEFIARELELDYLANQLNGFAQDIADSDYESAPERPLSAKG